MIAHFGKKFTIKAQQILDLPIRKRNCASAEKKGIERNAICASAKKAGIERNANCARAEKKGIERNANCAIAQLAQFAQLANYFAQRPPLLLIILSIPT